MRIWILGAWAVGCGATEPRPRAPAAGGCPEAGASEILAAVASTELDEVSGVVASRRHADVLWMHNDSGDRPRIFAIGAEGGPLADITLADVPGQDIEDIALSGDTLYVGDIGDNGRLRDHVEVLVLPEPDLDEPVAVVEVVRLQLAYPDGAHDAEALVVEPSTGDVFLLTKDWGGANALYRKRAPHTAGLTTLEHVVDVDFATDPLSGPTPTAADIDPSGGWLVVRTYDDTALLWPLAGPLGDALLEIPCTLELPPVGQGEAIAFSADGDALITLGEGIYPPLNRTLLRWP